MDVQNFLRIVITVVGMCVFIGIVLWAWSGRRKSAFDRAARIPLEDDERSASIVSDISLERSEK